MIYLKTKMDAIKSIIIFLFLLVVVLSCGQQGIQFDPQFYKGDYLSESVVNRHGVHIYANDPEFNNLACMSKEKVIELMQILYKARIPKKKRKKILKSIMQLLEEE